MRKTSSSNFWPVLAHICMYTCTHRHTQSVCVETRGFWATVFSFYHVSGTQVIGKREGSKPCYPAELSPGLTPEHFTR